jgi:mono/diheme cytochrome c family protein
MLTNMRKLGPRLLALAVGMTSPALSSTAMAEGASGVVTVGIRKPGAAGGDGLPEMLPVTQVDLDALALTVVERFDAQYGSTGIFTGVPLEALIGRIQAPAHADLALLHFGNGVVVPLPYRDRAAMKRLQPWVARGMHLTDTGMTIGAFRPITGRLTGYFDVPVIQFAGNKLVVAERWHPDIPARAQKDLSPWVHVDSLVAIELVNAASYNSMFAVQARTAPGQALFHQSCQFCHGVRQVGAKFGMDFVDPVPVHKWKDLDKRFYWHVKYRRPDPLVRGEMMPALTFMTEKEASAVWAWLRSVADRPLRPYQPGR